MIATDSTMETRESYEAIRAKYATSMLRRYEVPTGHLVSLPFPTNRWGKASYGFFASPYSRSPGCEAVLLPPDRFWSIAAHGGRLTIYALTAALPLQPAGSAWSPVTTPAETRTIEDIQTDLAALDQAMTPASEAFFSGHALDELEHLRDVVAKVVSEPVRPFYRAVAPDFWELLGL